MTRRDLGGLMTGALTSAAVIPTATFPDPAQSGLLPAQLLTCRRVDGSDLWTCLNKVQLCCARHNWTYVATVVMWSKGLHSRETAIVDARLST